MGVSKSEKTVLIHVVMVCICLGQGVALLGGCGLSGVVVWPCVTVGVSFNTLVLAVWK